MPKTQQLLRRLLADQAALDAEQARLTVIAANVSDDIRRRLAGLGISAQTLARLDLHALVEILGAVEQAAVIPIRADDVALLEAVLGASPASEERRRRAARVLDVVRERAGVGPVGPDQTAVFYPEPGHRKRPE